MTGSTGIDGDTKSDNIDEHRITNDGMELLFQGAESKIYLSRQNKTILKQRLSKSYRIKELDDKLVKQRTKREEKILKKLETTLNVPKVFKSTKNDIYMEYIDGQTVKSFLQTLTAGYESSAGDVLNDNESDKQTTTSPKNDDKIVDSESNKEIIAQVATEIGKGIAKMHSLNIVHGDLTTSNMIYKKLNTIYWIDFGLSYQSTNIEDQAVDLYVLERAIESTHPRLTGISSLIKGFFELILEAYRSSLVDPKAVLDRFEQVRQRGRKRVAFG